MTCHMYEALTPSAKMKILPANKATTIRLIPTGMVEGGEQWVDRMLAAQKSVVEDGEDINLYISLNGDSAASSFFIMNLLDILVSMPGSGVHLKKAFTDAGMHYYNEAILLNSFGTAARFTQRVYVAFSVGASLCLGKNAFPVVESVPTDALVFCL